MRNRKQKIDRMSIFLKTMIGDPARVHPKHHRDGLQSVVDTPHKDMKHMLQVFLLSKLHVITECRDPMAQANKLLLPRGMLPLGSGLGSTNHRPPFSNI